MRGVDRLDEHLLDGLPLAVEGNAGGDEVHGRVHWG